ncbi:polyhomeotic-like protein 2 [Sycon ciliatum]|uniref:polyhomeotic-like protein 2 n=1 Tax=Sycon ciliatum TaxID=27933 RepID=UPI0031F6739E
MAAKVAISSQASATSCSSASLLIHYIDGCVIEESAEPFPDTFQVPEFVIRKAKEERLEAAGVEARRKEAKAQQYQLNKQQKQQHRQQQQTSRGLAPKNDYAGYSYHTRPAQEQAVAGAPRQHQQQHGYRRCEMCGVSDHLSQFSRSGRFCSVHCMRAYSNQFRGPNRVLHGRGGGVRSAGQPTDSRTVASYSHHQAAGAAAAAASNGVVHKRGRGRPPLAANIHKYMQQQRMAAAATASPVPVGQVPYAGQPSVTYGGATSRQYPAAGNMYPADVNDDEEYGDDGSDEDFFDGFLRETVPPVDVPSSLQSTDPNSWNAQDVMSFFQHHGLDGEARVLREHELDGEALAMLRSEHLVALGLKVGPALKIGQLASRLLSGIG